MVGNKAGVAWVPAWPKRLIGQGWPKLRAAWSAIWHREKPPESQLAEVLSSLVFSRRVAPVERVKVLKTVGAIRLGAIGHPVWRLYG